MGCFYIDIRQFKGIFMVNISRLFFRVTGIMPKKEIIRTCKGIGLELAKDCKSGAGVDVARVRELLAKSIGAKEASKIVIADDFETFKKFTSKIGFDESFAKQYFDSTLSAVIPNAKNKSTLLSLRISGMTTAEALNTTSHELEHVLFKNLSPRVLMEKLYVKIRGNKFIEKYIQKYGLLLNEKVSNLQGQLIYRSKVEGGYAIGGYISHPLGKQGLLAQMGLDSEKSLQDLLKGYVRSGLSECNPKLNSKILKVYKVILKDESRAYKVGGAVERKWSESIGEVNPNATKSEILASLYDETIKVVKKEIKQLRKDRLKAFFHLSGKKKVVKPDFSPAKQKVTVIENPVKKEDLSDAVSKALYN